jgi:acetolactate synthase-1/2/3 large subunit
MSLGRFPLDRFLPGSADLDEAAALLANAQRPIVIAGGVCICPERAMN